MSLPSPSVAEIVIQLKNAEKTLKTNHLCYDKITLSTDDPILKSFVEEAVKDFKEVPEDVIVKCKLVWS